MHEQTLSGDPTLVLPEFDAPPPDPFPLLQRWIADAEQRGVREPRAATLATTDGQTVSTRTILLKDLQDDVIVFGTHVGSRKGRDLRQVPQAGLTLYWRETLQQISVAGPVELLDAARSDALFTGRPRHARATAVVSRQSEPLVDEAALRREVEALAASAADVPRPEGWAAWAVRPRTVEFWHGRADRLHRRLAYEHGPGGWAARRLQP